MPSPGEHRIVIGQEHDALQARSHGWHLRDTITILLPGPRTAFAFLLRWPLQGTVVDTVLAHGTGALNINGCRIMGAETITTHSRGMNQAFPKRPGETSPEDSGRKKEQGTITPNPRTGRWPSNLVLVHAPDCVQMGSKTVKGSNIPGMGSRITGFSGCRGEQSGIQRYTDASGTETVPAYDCAPHCPVRLLDLQSGNRETSKPGSVVRTEPWKGFHGGDGVCGTPEVAYGDAGGASRFYPQFADLTEAVRWLACLIDQ